MNVHVNGVGVMRPSSALGPRRAGPVIPTSLLGLKSAVGRIRRSDAPVSSNESTRDRWNASEVNGEGVTPGYALPLVPRR